MREEAPFTLLNTTGSWYTSLTCPFKNKVILQQILFFFFAQVILYHHSFWGFSQCNLLLKGRVDTGSLLNQIRSLKLKLKTI